MGAGVLGGGGMQRDGCDVGCVLAKPRVGLLVKQAMKEAAAELVEPVRLNPSASEERMADDSGLVREELGDQKGKARAATTR